MHTFLDTSGSNIRKVFPELGDKWIVRVPWDVMENYNLLEITSDVKELLQETNGERGAICNNMWVEFWFNDYNNAFHFYMVYG